MKYWGFFSVICFVGALFVSCTSDKAKKEVEPNYPTVNTPMELTTPKGFPKLVLNPNNPMSKERVALGRMLYYDPILSNNGNSCSSCHSQNRGFTDSTFNSLAHVNLAWNTSFLWDGSHSGSLEDMMMYEVETFFGTDVSKLNQHSTYPTLFRNTFGVSKITSKEISYALAQFFRTMISSNSKYDRFIRHETQLTQSELNGYQLFMSEKGDCFHCHVPGLFMDNSFHNIGLDGYNQGERGYQATTGNPKDFGKFKTPTLRNIALSSPYMHDARFKTLAEVIDHYASGVKAHEQTDDLLAAHENFMLDLSAQDKQDLIAFLETLTDSTYIQDTLLSSPF